MDTTARSHVSVVIPLYNEEESLALLHQELEEVLDTFSSYEVVFVDDGSTDGSSDVLRRLYREKKNVKVVVLRKNVGKAEALWVGFQAAGGRYIVTLDADLQDDPREIPRLVRELERGADVVSGWKRVRRDPIQRRIASRLFNGIVRITTHIPLHDFNCGIKAYRQEVVRSLDIYGELHRFIPVLAHNQGFRVSEISVHHRPRRFGKTKYGAWRALHGIIDLFTVLIITRYFQRPAHFFGTIGALFFLVGFFADAYVTFLKVTTGSTQGKIPLLIFGVLMIVVGIHLISLGFLAELLVRTRQRRRPPIREVLE